MRNAPILFTIDTPRTPIPESPSKQVRFARPEPDRRRHRSQRNQPQWALPLDGVAPAIHADVFDVESA